jgi:branched-chain amino acid aminotransferase
MKLAEHLGMKVEKRPVPLTELETFEEIGACGTAAVISPIGTVADLDNQKFYTFCKDGKAGPISTKLYNYLVGLQYGEVEDTFEWITVL